MAALSAAAAVANAVSIAREVRANGLPYTATHTANAFASERRWAHARAPRRRPRLQLLRRLRLRWLRPLPLRRRT